MAVTCAELLQRLPPASVPGQLCWLPADPASLPRICNQLGAGPLRLLLPSKHPARTFFTPPNSSSMTFSVRLYCPAGAIQLMLPRAAGGSMTRCSISVFSCTVA